MKNIKILTSLVAIILAAACSTTQQPAPDPEPPQPPPPTTQDPGAVSFLFDVNRIVAASYEKNPGTYETYANLSANLDAAVDSGEYAVGTFEKIAKATLDEMGEDAALAAPVIQDLLVRYAATKQDIQYASSLVAGILLGVGEDHE